MRRMVLDASSGCKRVKTKVMEQKNCSDSLLVLRNSSPTSANINMCNPKLGHAVLNSPKLLYKYLLRECDKLPKDARQFYKHSVKQSFKQHLIEPDKERVRQIMEKAVQDAEWVINKYATARDEKTLKK